MKLFAICLLLISLAACSHQKPKEDPYVKFNAFIDNYNKKPSSEFIEEVIWENEKKEVNNDEYNQIYTQVIDEEELFELKQIEREKYQPEKDYALSEADMDEPEPSNSLDIDEELTDSNVDYSL